MYLSMCIHIYICDPSCFYLHTCILVACCAFCTTPAPPNGIPPRYTGSGALCKSERRGPGLNSEAQDQPFHRREGGSRGFLHNKDVRR